MKRSYSLHYPLARDQFFPISKNSTQDTTIRLNHTFSGENFIVNISFQADSVIFDPEWWIISNNNSVVTGIKDYESSLGIEIYPNPAKDFIIIHTDERMNSNSFITISNLIGESIIVSPFTGNDRKVDVSSIAPGIYFIKLTSGKKVSVIKFIRQ